MTSSKYMHLCLLASSTVITRDMKRTLVEDLNYSLKDVNKLKPEEAVEIIQKGIRNPKKDFRRPGTSGPDELR